MLKQSGAKLECSFSSSSAGEREHRYLERPQSFERKCSESCNQVGCPQSRVQVKFGSYRRGTPTKP